jgi:hypothetical protein
VELPVKAGGIGDGQINNHRGKHVTEMSWSATRIITYIATCSVLALLSEYSKNRKLPLGNKTVTVSTPARLLVFVVLVIFLLMFWDAAKRADKGLMVFSVILICLGLYQFVVLVTTRVMLEEAAVNIRTLWCQREMVYKDIVRIEKSLNGYEYILSDRYGNKVKILIFITGSLQIVSEIKERCGGCHQQTSIIN